MNTITELIEQMDEIMKGEDGFLRQSVSEFLDMLGINDYEEENEDEDPTD